MSPTDEILSLNKRLLDAIVAGDWKAYEELCHPQITCFEPEACGHLVHGMAFHRFYFDLPGGGGPRHTTVVAPHVKFCGDDVALVAYVRLTQKLGPDGNPVSTAVQETRMWQREGGRWRHIHFHRSPC